MAAFGRDPAHLADPYEVRGLMSDCETIPTRCGLDASRVACAQCELYRLGAEDLRKQLDEARKTIADLESYQAKQHERIDVLSRQAVGSQ